MNYLILLLGMLPVYTFSAVDLVTVDKSERTMLLLDGDQIIKAYQVSFGENPMGHKVQEGDERTPEGSYILDYKNEESSFYRSMHISYPNALDLQHAKDLGVSAGGLIMVHGQRNWFSWLAPIVQRFNWTDGCIALTNSEMDEFMALVDVGTKINIAW